MNWHKTYRLYSYPAWRDILRGRWDKLSTSSMNNQMRGTASGFDLQGNTEKSALDLAFQLLLHCIFVPDLVTFLMLGSSKLIPKTNNDQLLKNIWPRACPTRPHPFAHSRLLQCRRLLVSTSSKSFYKKSVRFWYLFLFINKRAEIVLEANGVDLPQHLNINTHNNRFITYKIEENNWLFTA